MKIILTVLVILLVSPAAFAEEKTDPTGKSAMIDSAEDTGKSMAGSAIDGAASEVGGVAGATVANTGKAMAGQAADEKIGTAADSARSKYGIETKSKDTKDTAKKGKE